MKTVYYAHALCVYGSNSEAAELKAIRSRFKKHKIVNPANYENHPEKQKETVNFCLRLIEKCDIVVFSCLLEKITAGVGKEINHALKLGLAVYELKPTGFSRRHRPVKYLSRARTIHLYGKWRQLQWRNSW
jgi:hypothetical protein